MCVCGGGSELFAILNGKTNWLSRCLWKRGEARIAARLLNEVVGLWFDNKLWKLLWVLKSLGVCDGMWEV